ncbi:MAG: hypothetical protein M0C28_45710 [Candidatus Moduliflexus flocculans]|nr:hypothetical protein [Candidatus Moduliflexus flocculans]
MATRKTKIRPRPAAANDAGPIGDAHDEKYNQLRMALEAADIGLWDWDLSSNRIAMSANMKTLLEIGERGRTNPSRRSCRSFIPTTGPGSSTP